jgi:ATP-dependent DNA helicase RecQ
LQRERRQKFGAGHIVDILLGRKTAKVIQHDHDTLTVFGIGTELSENEWRGVVRQLLAQGLLRVEGDHGTLLLTDESADVLGRRRDVLMRRETVRPPKNTAAKAARSQAAADLPAAAQPVFARLRAWRAATAKEQGVPAYVIFHDATLRQIATEAPTTLSQLSRISGMGENKLAKYGQPILDTLHAEQ